MNQTYMKDNSIFPLVLTMSLPMIISMLVNAMYNIVDSYFVAQISGNAMTALSLVFPLQNLVNSVAIGFGIGINAAVAFFLGAEKREAANASVRKGLILSGLHGILLTGICIFGASRFISLFTTNSEILTYSLDYSYIVFAFSPIVTLGVSLEKIFQSVGRMKISMLSMLCGCIINIILDPIFIFGLGFVPEMGIKGAALATGIGQLSTLALYIYFFKKIPLPIQLVKTPPASTYHDRSEYKTGDIYRRLYLVGVPATLNLALPSLLITALNGILVEFSQIYVLILGIYYKLQTFIYFTASGIVQGIRPLVGYNYGAGRPDRVRKIFRISLALAALIMAVGTILCFLIPEEILRLFSSDPETITEGALALRFISIGFIVSAMSIIASGTFEGLGQGIPSLIISLIRFIVIIPIAFLLSRPFGASGVWHGFWVTEILAAALSFLLIQRFFNKSLHKIVS